MKNKLSLVSLGTCFGLVFAWQAGCGDPNPRGVITVGGSGGATVGSGGAPGSGGSTLGTGGATVGSGGTSASGGATGQGGEVPGSGGATAGHGGTAASSGGTVGAGGAGGGGGMNGSAGGASVVSDVIDDLDDGDGRILLAGGRQGPWHSFNDSSGGNQQPSINGPFTPQAGGVNGSPYAAHTTGSGYQFGGIGFDLDNPSPTAQSMQSQSYNASAYKGITFWAKGNGNLRVEFSQKAFVPQKNGGSCNESTTTCWNVYGSRSAQGTLSLTDWKQVTITFSSLERQDGSKTPAFDPSQLMGIAFKHEGDTFDFWIDDVELTK